MSEPAAEMVKTIQRLIDKELSKQPRVGLVTGEVLSPPPLLKVQIHPRLIVDGKDIMIAQHAQEFYWRNFVIEKSGEVVPLEGQKRRSSLSFEANDTTDGTLSGGVNSSQTGVTNATETLPANTVPCLFAGAPPHPTITTSDPGHDHTQKEVNLENTNFLMEGAIKWTNGLKTGDIVIMAPAADRRTWFLIDKCRRADNPEP